MDRFWVGVSMPKRMQPAIRRNLSDSQKVLDKPIRNACRHFCDRRRFEQKSMKNAIFFWTSILEAFWDDFGRVWVRFWEAETVDFRCFSDTFSKTNFRRRFGRQKIEKNCRKPVLRHVLGPARRNVQGPGRDIERGYRSSRPGN